MPCANKLLPKEESLVTKTKEFSWGRFNRLRLVRRNMHHVIIYVNISKGAFRGIRMLVGQGRQNEQEKQIPHRRSPKPGDRVRDDTVLRGWRLAMMARTEVRQLGIAANDSELAGTTSKRQKADPSPSFAKTGRPGSG